MAIQTETMTESPGKNAQPEIVRMNANNPETTAKALVEIIQRDGGVIVEHIISQHLVDNIKSDLKPYFDTDKVDPSGFFPLTTQRATGLLGRSDACVELALNPLYNQVAKLMLTSVHKFWSNGVRKQCESLPVISSTVGFRVNPGGRQQELHRDDGDYHAGPKDWPVMLGCVTALIKTTAANGATVVIPGSHKWDPERCPRDDEAIPAELEPGSALIFVGNLYRAFDRCDIISPSADAGGGNITKDEKRETVGIFMCKGYLSMLERKYTMVPPELCKQRKLSPEALRLLGYGISEPSCGFHDYKDPMESIFGIIDDKTVRM